VKESIVFVVDDDASVRRSLERLLGAVGYRVETFGSAAAFLERAPHEGPSCLVLDVQLPGADGFELLGALAQAERILPVIFITGHGDIPMSVRAMKVGAVDFLPKPFSDEDLLRAIEQGLDRCRSERSGDAELADVRRRLSSLTPREREVLTGVVAGSLNRQVAVELGIAEKTVKVHRARVMTKMGVTSLADLVRIAARVGARNAR
jgi:FixJ family two-component response regulator